MSLVADYGSGSDDESQNQQETFPEINAQIDQNLLSKLPQSENKLDSLPQNKKELDNNLFSQLPHKKSQTQNFVNDEDQIEDFVPKSAEVKEKPKAKITIPSLSDFKDDLGHEPEEKKLKLSNKGSGLLSLLPPVKGIIKTAKSFVPNVVANKNKISTNPQSKKIPNAIKEKKALVMKKNLVKKGNELTIKSDAESEDEDIELPETFDDEMWLKVCSRPKPKKVTRDEPQPSNLIETTVDIAPEPEKPYDGLDNEAFKELVGKTKRPIGNIKLIDINEEEILPDKDLWMTKSLTDPEMAPKATVEDPVDPTKRKKHHITYLAQQAKANEQELANAWAASKNSRLASRAKYGF